MEKKYIEDRIKIELLNKEFKDWTYETIDFLVYIYDFDQYQPYYNMNLLLLEDYIKWYQENSTELNNQIYSLEKLHQLSTQIKKDLNVSNYYKNFLNNNIKEKINNSIFDNIYFVFLIILMFVFLVIKSFMSNILFKKKEEPLKKIELNSSILDNVFPENSSLYTDKSSDKFKSLIKLLLDNFIGL